MSGQHFVPHKGFCWFFKQWITYTPTIWPWEDGKQQQMAHIDFKVDSLPEAGQLAIKHGAKKAKIQYYDTSTVMFDSAGHPFCFSTVQQ